MNQCAREHSPGAAELNKNVSVNVSDYTCAFPYFKSSSLKKTHIVKIKVTITMEV